MLKKTIKYTDYDGNEREEEFRFNLSEAELAEMELSVSGGLTQLVQNVIATKDVPKIMEMFKGLILKSYGEKSADGRRFIKSEELSTAFSQTEAYTVLFMELGTNAEKAAEFVNGIVPPSYSKKVTA